MIESACKLYHLHPLMELASCYSLPRLKVATLGGWWCSHCMQVYPGFVYVFWVHDGYDPLFNYWLSGKVRELAFFNLQNLNWFLKIFFNCHQVGLTNFTEFQFYCFLTVFLEENKIARFISFWLWWSCYLINCESRVFFLYKKNWLQKIVIFFWNIDSTFTLKILSLYNVKMVLSCT